MKINGWFFPAERVKLLLILAPLFGGLLFWATSVDSAARLRMPVVSDIPLRNGGTYPSAASGLCDATMEVRGAGREVVVWRYRDKILAVVWARPSDFTSFLDSNFDGYVDEVAWGKAGSGDAGDFYRKAGLCKK